MCCTFIWLWEVSIHHTIIRNISFINLQYQHIYWDQKTSKKNEKKEVYLKKIYHFFHVQYHIERLFLKFSFFWLKNAYSKIFLKFPTIMFIRKVTFTDLDVFPLYLFHPSRLLGTLEYYHVYRVSFWLS